MKKKLYYTVQHERDNDGMFDTLTGMKTVSVYEMVDNAPKQLFELDLTNESDSQEEIQGYLNDNGMGDDEIELILL
jgi:hypothetical protein